MKAKTNTNTVTPFRGLDAANKQNLHISALLANTNRCCKVLMNEGFTVLDISMSDSKPEIEIQYRPKCNKLKGRYAKIISNGLARVYRYQTEIENCTVYWFAPEPHGSIDKEAG